MANYCATARTNYFKVKNEQAFEDWLDTTNMEILNKDVDQRTGHTVYALQPTAPDGEGWSLTLWEDDEGVELEEERDLVGELADHLEDDWVAIFMESGAEKLRYITGFAIAVNSKGEREDISLSEIYKKAERLGGRVSPAEY